MKYTKLFYLISTILLFASVGKTEITQGLLFHAAFEVNINADFSAGQNKCTLVGKRTPEFVDGIKGQGILTGNLAFSFATANNISPEAGTLILWIKPLTWMPINDNQTRSFFGTILKESDGSISQIVFNKYYNSGVSRYSNKLSLVVISGNNTKMSSPVEIDGWKTNEWHCIAATWERSSEEVRVYVDGHEKIIDRAPLPSNFGKAFYLGTAHSKDPETVLDEVRIYNRVLSLEEIREIYMDVKQQ